MATDPNRASFVQQEYRFEEAEDPTVRATYTTARRYIHNTNLRDASVAEALADRIFAETREPAVAFKVEVEGIFLIDTLDGGPLRYEVQSEKYGQEGRVFKVATIECDPFRNRTSFQVRG